MDLSVIYSNPADNPIRQLHASYNNTPTLRLLMPTINCYMMSSWTFSSQQISFGLDVSHAMKKE